MADLLNSLGGSSGFGENDYVRDDDPTDSTGIDLTTVFGEQGVKFGNSYYTTAYINNNGMITFGASADTYTPNGLSDGVDDGSGNYLPAIALYWTDIDTSSNSTVDPSAGGTSTGSNLVHWDIDTVNKIITITWDDVEEYSYDGTNTPVLAGQIVLKDAGSGNMDIQFRYEYVPDLQDHTVTAGWNVGVTGGAEGIDYFEVPIAGGTSAGNFNVLSDLDTREGNTAQVGIWDFFLRDGGVYNDADAVPASSSTTVQFDFTTIYNADVIVTAAEFGDGYQSADGAFDSWAAFIENGVAGGAGIPSGGVIAAIDGVHPEVTLQMTDNNAWKVGGVDSVTANITEGNYRTVHVFASAGDAGVGNNAYFNVILHYSDGSSTTSPQLTAPDWYDDSSVDGRYTLIDNMDRMDNSGNLEDANDPAIFGFAVAADYTKTLTSITIDVTQNNAGVFAFFGGVATDEVSSAALAATSQNADPVITSNGGGVTAAVNVAENATAVTTVTTTDGDNDTITYSISGGADQAKFSLNSSTGALSFVSAPNYETPTDSDTNNTYVVEVTANDGNSGTDIQTITVSVTDVNESTYIPPSTPPTTTNIISDGTLDGLNRTPTTTTTVGTSTVTTQTGTGTRTYVDDSGHTVTQNNVMVEAVQITAPISGSAVTTATIPLYWGESTRNAAATTASVSSGVTLSSEGNRAPTTTQTHQSAIDDLIYYIQTTVPSTDSTKSEMLSGGSSFLSQMENINTLVVNKVTLSATSTGTAPATVSLDGTANSVTTNGVTDTPKEALVIDATSLQGGSTLTLSNIEFGVLAGSNLNVVLNGTASQTVFSGSGTQTFTTLASNQNQLFAGAGNDQFHISVPSISSLSASRAEALNSLSTSDTFADSIVNKTALYGEDGNDTTTVDGTGTQNVFVHGGSGEDSISYQGSINDYTITRDNGITYVHSNATSKTDLLLNVESIQFDDGSYTMAYNNDLTQIASLYQQVLGRQADVDGFQYWASTFDNGDTIGAIATSFVCSSEYFNNTSNVWDAMSNAQRIETFYELMLGRASDAAGKGYWMDAVNNGMSIEDIAGSFVVSAEMQGICPAAQEWNFTA